eukprot:GHVU01079070.1.p1 GENE.GHVU01079070.1~~GHVU01079070.1.p1  ORF type:complete len:149 (-),score=13.05 GHVU01079070.1:879-1325(-)
MMPKPGVQTCTIIIDGMALVQAFGKPSGTQTFGDLASIFTMNIHSNFTNYCSRVDVVFDRYYEQSIKGGTRQTRSGKSRPIRRIIDNKSIKLPKNWHNCITLDDNKENLAEFLCQELVKNPRGGGKEVVVGGGFVEIDKTMSSVGRDV